MWWKENILARDAVILGVKRERIFSSRKARCAMNAAMLSIERERIFSSCEAALNQRRIFSQWMRRCLESNEREYSRLMRRHVVKGEYSRKGRGDS